MQRRRSSRQRLRVGVLLAGVALGVPLSAGGFWSGTSVPGGSGAAAAGSVQQGATPTASPSGRAVTVTWTARTLSQGTAVDGYTVLRRDASTAAAQTVLSGCSGTIASLTCTELGVPAGAWVYHVAPVFEQWQGVEGLGSATVTISAPSAPTGVTATARSQAAAVSWSAPSAGSSPITSYTATAGPGGATCTTATTSCTIGGLDDDTDYTVTVTATSLVGTGPASSPVAVTPRAAPGAPTAVSATTADGSSSVSWTAPAGTGGSAITSYTATATPANSSAATATCTSASSPCTLPLLNGLTYAVSVAATNAYGMGASSAAASTSPYPTTLLVASEVALWVDSSDPTTLYTDSACTTAATTGTVGCWKDKSGNGLDLTQSTAASRMTIGSLHSRTALTSTGTTWYSAGSATGTFRTVISVGDPDRSSDYSTTLAADANSDFSQRIVSGSLPTSTDAADWHHGGSAWTDGVLAGAPPASGAAIFVSEASIQQTGRTVSIGTSFQSRGFVGPLGEVLAFQRTLTTAERRSVEDFLARKWGAPLSPGAPTGATAVSSSTSAGASVTAGWTAPTWDGGSAVTSYTATASPGGASCTTSGSTCTISGLTGGTSYTVTVSATNAIGAGPTATAAPVTPRSVPGAPGAVFAAPQDSAAQVSWPAPVDGGSPVTSYTATALPGGASCTTAATTCTITGLTNGTTYTVTVTATNAVGTGPASPAGTVTPGPAPGAPSGVMTALSADTATVSWTPPADEGASAIRSYTGIAYPYEDAGLPAVECTSSASPCTVTGLVYGADYLFTVEATNDAGTGAAATGVHDSPYPDTLLTSSNLGAWVDASRAGTLYGNPGCTTTASSGVGCLKDRAGESLTFTQATSAAQPTLSTLHGRTALLSTATTWLTSSGSGTWRTILTAGSADRTAAWSTTFASAANTDFSQRLNDGSLLPRDGSDWGNDGSTWVSGAADGSQPSSGAVLYESEAAASRTGTASISTSFLSRGFVGPIGEVLAFNRVLTASERRTAEEYLARKWGAVITPAAPSVPTVAVTGSGTATVSWTAPSWDGGATVTSYVVTPSTGTGACTWSAGLSASCTGLAPGTSQGFAVVARNSRGAGPSASTSAVTPGPVAP